MMIDRAGPKPLNCDRGHTVSSDAAIAVLGDSKRHGNKEAIASLMSWILCFPGNGALVRPAKLRRSAPEVSPLTRCAQSRFCHAARILRGWVAAHEIGSVVIRPAGRSTAAVAHD